MAPPRASAAPQRKPQKGLGCPKCGGAWVVKKGNSKGKQRFSCRSCGWHGTQPAGIEKRNCGIDRKSTATLHRAVRSAKGIQRYVITAAQNATGVHAAFFASLNGYCKSTGATLLVIPYRYKNPTSMWSRGAQDDDWWAPELVKHLLDRRTRLNANILLLADIKTQPTATTPLQGFETISGSHSAIIGHPKLELATIPTPQNKLPKILTTTGAVTVSNYLPSKAGKKGEHHHTLGACVVELDGKIFHMRQINAARDGSFIDLDTEYSGADAQPAKLAGLVMGDSHIEFIDAGVARATFEGRDSLLHRLKPDYLVWHDVHDFYSRMHHHRGKVFTNFVKHHTGHDNVEKSLDESFAFIDRVTPEWVRNVFPASNHPDMFARWLEETDPRTDLENCVFWAKSFVAMCDGSKWTDSGARTPDPFAYWAGRKMKTAKQATFLGHTDHFQIAGVEVGYHGHTGPNGSRGTIRGFGKIGVRSVIGHSHTPGIKDGVYQVGTSAALDMEFVRGPSSWLHTHCLVYKNGKRSLVNIIDGKWRA